MTPFPACPLPGLTQCCTFIHYLIVAGCGNDQATRQPQYYSTVQSIFGTDRCSIILHQVPPNTRKHRESATETIYFRRWCLPLAQNACETGVGHSNSVAGACSIRSSLGVKAGSSTRTVAGASRHRFARIPYHTSHQAFPFFAASRVSN